MSENEKVNNDTEVTEELKTEPTPEKLLAEKERELLYLRAEFDNYRKQNIKERSELIRYAGEALARDLLSVVDVFDKALENEISQDNYTSFVEGVKLTQKELLNVFEKHGIKELDCKDKTFDPNHSEALTQVPSPNHKEGDVMEVLRKGYLFHEKVLRHAQVVIAAAAPEEKG